MTSKLINPDVSFDIGCLDSAQASAPLLLTHCWLSWPPVVRAAAASIQALPTQLVADLQSVPYDASIARQYGFALGGMAAQNLAVAFSDGSKARPPRCIAGGQSGVISSTQRKQPMRVHQKLLVGLQDAKKNALRASGLTWLVGAALLAQARNPASCQRH